MGFSWQIYWGGLPFPSPEKKRTTEGEIVGWHHWCNGHEFGQTPGDGGGQGGLTCCSPWGHEESDKTWWLIKNPLSAVSVLCYSFWCSLLLGARMSWEQSSFWIWDSPFFFFPHRASNEPLPFLVWTFHTLTQSSALFVLWNNYFFVVCIWRYFLQMQSLFYSPIWPVSWLWDMPFHP